MSPERRDGDVSAYVREWAARVDRRLEQILDVGGDCPESLARAMNYSVFSGGKRLRPVMAIAAAEAAGAEPAEVPGLIDVACAIEMVHTYSLIHDDLPCMDDDDFRRGKPSSHRVFGEAVAVLAGDALLTYAFEVMVASGASPDRIVRAVREIARCAGAAGMVGGQVLDMEMEGVDVPAQADAIRRMHVLKTSRMFCASVSAGGILAGAGPDTVESLRRFATEFGLGFQIADDVKDAATGRDAGKATYVSAFGVEAARRDAVAALESAVRELDGFGDGAWALRGIARCVAQGVAEGD